MSETPEEVAARVSALLAREGWTVELLRTNALTVVDEVKDVIRVTARKGPFRAYFVRLGDVVDGDDVDRFEKGGPLVAEGRSGRVTYRVEVEDDDAAERERLVLHAMSGDRSFDDAKKRMEARGFRLDERLCHEETYDTSSWQLAGVRGEEHYLVHIAFQSPVTLSVTCKSLPRARALLLRLLEAEA